MARQPQTVFGESPTPDPTPQVVIRSVERGGIVRGILLVTGAFIVLALFIILIGQLPIVPQVVGFTGQGEWQDVLAEDEAILSSYGWVEPESGIVRIPVKEAMKIVEDEGLPARPLEEVPAGETEEEEAGGESQGREIPADEAGDETPTEEAGADEVDETPTEEAEQ
jgi:hypothetical protein